ncbi:MAG TPA: cyclase family protein [Thermoplasmata archaeon]|jgi:arylformamidase|nr:cyclase family protein [Thermoplasmata archaeon]
MAGSPRVHDLTALLETNMATWPTSPAPSFAPVALVPRDGYSMERIDCLTHTGTHVDAPYHFLEDGRTVDRIPPERLVGTGVVLDLRAELEGTLIPRPALERHWPARGTPEIVLLRTDWSRVRGPTRRYLYDFPGLSVDAAEWLALRGLKGVGTDTLGIDPYANTEYAAHKALLRHDIWLVEALDHLDELEEGREYTVVVAPLKIAGGSGGMARVLAIARGGTA